MDGLSDFDLWDLDMPAKVFVKCHHCDEEAVRGIELFHLDAFTAEDCVNSKRVLVCRDHYLVTTKRAKAKADAAKPCWRCKKTQTEFYEIIREDWPL